MAELHRLQSQNVELFKHLDNKVVKQNNGKDHERYLNLLNVNGPDPAATTLLQEKAIEWHANPLSFWHRPVQNALNFGNSPELSPQAQIVGYYMQAGSDHA
jgi:hypothetical protein